MNVEDFLKSSGPFRRPVGSMIFVPAETEGGDEPTASLNPFVRIYLTHEEVTGQAGDWADAVRLLSEYSLPNILSTLAQIGSALHGTSLEEQNEVQARLVRWLWDDRADDILATAEEARRKLMNEGAAEYSLTVFHELQLVNAAKLCLLELPPDNEQSTDSGEELGVALLIVNDILGGQEAPTPLAEGDDADRRVAMERFLVMNSAFHTNDTLIYALARSAELYIADRSHLPRTDYVDLPKLLETATGLSTTALWSGCFAIYANRVQLEQKELPGPLEVASYFSEHYDLPGDDEEALWNVLGAPPDWHRAGYIERGCGHGELKPYDNLPLEQRPMVLVDGRAHCPSIELLVSRFSTGLHHILLNAQEDWEAREKYLRYLGQVFADYCLDLLSRVYPDGKRLIPDSDLHELASEDAKVCDALVDYPNRLVALEFKATLLPLAVRTEGEWTGLVDVLERTVLSAAEQLDSTIAQAMDGQFADGRITPDRIDCYLPVLVTLEQLPMNPITYERLEGQIAGLGALQQEKSAAIQVLSVQDLELLEALSTAGFDLSDLLLERVNGGHQRFGSFKDFIFLKYPGILDEIENEYLVERFAELGAQATSYFETMKKTA